MDDSTDDAADDSTGMPDEMWGSIIGPFLWVVGFLLVLGMIYWFFLR